MESNEESTRQDGSKLTLGRIVFGTSPLRTLLRASLLAIVVWLCVRHVATVCVIRGQSMEPTFRDKSIHVIDLLRFRFRDPQRGEVVVVSMGGRRALYLKRVLGLPGERIVFREGHLFVNGRKHDEDYVVLEGDWNTPEVQLDDNEYFLAGDNRSSDLEQHVVGIVHRDRIAGRTLF